MDYSKIRGGHGRPSMVHTPKPKRRPKYRDEYDFTPLSEMRDCPECGEPDSMDHEHCRLCGWPYKK